MPELVALQTMLPKFKSPIEAQAEVLQLRQMQAASAAQQAEAQARQQAMADDQAVRAAYSANPTDGAARLNALAGVSPKAYATEATQQATLGKAKADTEKSQLELTKKKIDLGGQAFGYVRNNPTPENALSAISWLTQQGVYTPEQAAEYAAKVQAEPGNVKAMADQAFAAALDAKEQMLKIETRDTGGQVQTIGIDPVTSKVSTLSTLAKSQTPDNIASNNVRVSEGAKDRSAAAARQAQQIAASREKESAAGGADASLDEATLNRMADQALRGDRTVFNNIGRGKQGSANLVALHKKITQLGTDRGIDGAALAGITADYSGQQAALRTSGNISARVENAISEAKELAPLALEASKKVARSGLLPFGKAGIMFDTQTNNPDLKSFATANNGLVSAYAGAMARGQKPTVSDFEHARHILSEAQSQPAYEATVAQMYNEMEAASRAPQNVRKHLREEIAGKKAGGTNTTTIANPVAPVPKTGAVEGGFRFKGGDPSKQSSWEKI